MQDSNPAPKHYLHSCAWGGNPSLVPQNFRPDCMLGTGFKKPASTILFILVTVYFPCCAKPFSFTQSYLPILALFPGPLLLFPASLQLCLHAEVSPLHQFWVSDEVVSMSCRCAGFVLCRVCFHCLHSVTRGYHMSSNTFLESSSSQPVGLDPGGLPIRQPAYQIFAL